jgi:dTDP-glucose pyrophosphorylase/CBS domain-containing protein
MYTDLDTLCITKDGTIREAASRIDRSRLGIVLVIDADGKLVGTVTDGDLRRTMLAGLPLDSPLQALLDTKAASAYAVPVVGVAGSDSHQFLALLQQHKLSQLPVVDARQCVVGLVTLNDFLPDQSIGLQALIMAGGAGTRLHPLTVGTPKPMLPVGDRPLMQILIEQMREAGIKQVSVATHHHKDKITDHFGDGTGFGVELSYVAEDRPLGTAGALGLMSRPQETMLVINGDILTQVDFRAMLMYHRSHAADVTVAVRQFELQLPYGVIDCNGADVVSLREKPKTTFLINAGIYLLEPSVHDHIPSGERYDMTTLLEKLIAEGRPVVSFPLREYWLDIGQIDDYNRAQKDVALWQV